LDNQIFFLNLGELKPKGINRIAKIGYGQPMPRGRRNQLWSTYAPRKKKSAMVNLYPEEEEICYGQPMTEEEEL
jgi:hypothetical protein